jgi:hypothetical protein
MAQLHRVAQRNSFRYCRITPSHRVLICDNMAFHGDCAPAPAKHSKHLNLVDAVSIGGHRMQRNFEPLARHIQLVRRTPLRDDTTKLIIYRAFVEGVLATALLFPS